MVGPVRVSPLSQIVVAINVDSIYASTFVDVTEQPLVLSVPVGLAIARGQHLIFAVVPEFTLSARDRTPVRCISCSDELHDFEQHWALYFTMVYTATIGGDD